MLYLTADFFPIFVPLGVIGFYRYLVFVIKLLAWMVYRPIQPSDEPTYTPKQDVTIVVPTIDAGAEFLEAATSWLACDPKRIVIVTEACMKDTIQAQIQSLNRVVTTIDGQPASALFDLFTVPKASKREQMVQGIQQTDTDILVFADDDAIWPPTMLAYILASFEDASVGGVGTSQTVRSVGKRRTIWEILAGFRLTIRNIEVAASAHIDDGVCCISGRTAAYRTVILKDPGFQHAFTNDYWRKKYLLNSGDDKFLTRWMVSHGWSTHMQVCKGAELQSTFKDNWRFMKQILRWTRNTWRSDFRSLCTERYIWRRHPFVAFTMVDKALNPFTLLSGPISVIVLCLLMKFHLPAWNIVASYIVWLLGTRFIKLLPHFYSRPWDIWALPIYLIFNFYFAFMKLYAALTLHKTDWGTRKQATEDDIHGDCC
ncbi:glycosyltransferase like family 2-domain-containing protein [Gongronella butleri]|nr:glycosyltransferase like family 2-domain-containing protein [Gongronella butleri]